MSRKIVSYIIVLLLAMPIGMAASEMDTDAPGDVYVSLPPSYPIGYNATDVVIPGTVYYRLVGPMRVYLDVESEKGWIVAVEPIQIDILGGEGYVNFDVLLIPLQEEYDPEFEGKIDTVKVTIDYTIGLAIQATDSDTVDVISSGIYFDPSVDELTPNDIAPGAEATIIAPFAAISVISLMVALLAVALVLVCRRK